jgi:hypothetical protein
MVTLAGLLDVACVARGKMCENASECGASSCVAGRCQPDAGTPVVETARRLVLEPVDVAYVYPGQGEGEPLPAIALLGQGPARVLLRFSLPSLEPEIVEAYVVLQRVDLEARDGAPISLHVDRIVEPWSSRSTRWGLAPRIEDVRAPLTVVTGTADRPLVRLDVRDLVRKWKARDPRDQGLAVVSDRGSGSGMAFALVAGAGLGVSGSSEHQPAYIRGPVLELYVK